MEIEDKSKLFVFDKKEVILIFVFVIVITVTAFTLGVRVGKGLSLKAAGFTKEDVQKSIELKSIEEENADKDLSGSGSDFENSINMEGETINKVDPVDIDAKLEEEFSKAADGKLLDEDKKKEENKNQDALIPSDAVLSEPTSEAENIFVDGDANAGKFTIQLVSLESREEAEKYAEPFVAANYVVVINKATVAGKGVWYRVGIGLFDSHNEAKEYLEKEKSLFRGKNYLINQIK